jgi:hypothetical protein
MMLHHVESEDVTNDADRASSPASIRVRAPPERRPRLATSERGVGCALRTRTTTRPSCMPSSTGLRPERPYTHPRVAHTCTRLRTETCRRQHKNKASIHLATKPRTPHLHTPQTQTPHQWPQKSQWGPRRGARRRRTVRRREPLRSFIRCRRPLTAVPLWLTPPPRGRRLWHPCRYSY